jgi:hypothetical protein
MLVMKRTFMRPSLRTDDDADRLLTFSAHGTCQVTGRSPRHQPDLVRQIAIIPRTLTGKRMEVPVKRALLDPGTSVPGEPDGLGEFRALGRQLAAAAAARENSPRAT